METTEGGSPVIVRYIKDGSALYRFTIDPGPPVDLTPERLTAGGWVFYRNYQRLGGWGGSTDGDDISPEAAAEMAAEIAPDIDI